MTMDISWAAGITSMCATRVANTFENSFCVMIGWSASQRGKIMGLVNRGPDNAISIATYAFFILYLMFPWPIYSQVVSDGENLPRVCIQPTQESHEVNLGRLHCKLVSKKTFLIENASGNDWRVQKVKSGCGCVKASIAQETEVPSKPDCLLTVNCAVLPQPRAGKFEVPIALVDDQDNVLCEIVVIGIHLYSFDVKQGGMLLSTPKKVSGMSEEVILTRNFHDDDISKVKWRLLQSSIDGVAVAEVARTESEIRLSVTFPEGTKSEGSNAGLQLELAIEDRTETVDIPICFKDSFRIVRKACQLQSDKDTEKLYVPISLYGMGAGAIESGAAKLRWNLFTQDEWGKCQTLIENQEVSRDDLSVTDHKLVRFNALMDRLSPSHAIHERLYLRIFVDDVSCGDVLVLLQKP